jgi:hypothetical protein
MVFAVLDSALERLFLQKCLPERKRPDTDSGRAKLPERKLSSINKKRHLSEKRHLIL